MSPRIRRGIILLLVAALVLAFAVSVFWLPHARGDGPSYLRVWTDRDVAYTLSTFHIYVDSRVLENNVSVPNRAAVNVTLFDVDHQVLVKQFTTPLFNGTADLPIPVEPVWTTAFLNISVQDLEHGLVGFATVQCRLSDDYVLYLFESKWAKSFTDFSAALTAAYDARATTERAISLAFDATWALLVVFLFLRIDHRRSRAVGLPSLWDRFSARVWPYSILPDELGTWLDPERTWDRPTAEAWRVRRRFAAIKRVRGRIEEEAQLEEDLATGKVVVE